MTPILGLIKRIEFVSPAEVDVVFEINGRLCRRRAYVNCSGNPLTFRLDGFWSPRPPQPIATEAEEAA